MSKTKWSSTYEKVAAALTDLGIKHHIGLRFISATCPFHDDRHPSLIIGKNDAHFHCFACGARGDFPKLYAEYRGISRSAAIEELVKKYQWKYKEDESYKKYLIIKHFADLAHQYLLNMKRVPNDLKLYIQTKHLKPIIEDEQFQIGYYPMRPPEKLKEKAIDMIGETEERIRGRLIIPWISDRRYLLISARSLDGSVPKYLYQPVGFPKSSLCYLNPNLSNPIIVEGQFDAARLRTMGYNAVAQGGSTLNEAQIAELRRLMVRNVILFPDNDPPGISGAFQNAVSLMSKGILPKVVISPKDGVDPGDILDIEEVNLLMRNPMDIVEFTLKYRTKHDLSRFNKIKMDLYILTSVRELLKKHLGIDYMNFRKRGIEPVPPLSFIEAVKNFDPATMDPDMFMTIVNWKIDSNLSDFVLLQNLQGGSDEAM